MLHGERLSFAEEARGLYGVRPELNPLSAYDPILARIERLVPGTGPLAERVDAFPDRFIIPRERLEAVMRAAIAECRRRTAAHIPLPAGERFTLEFVTDKTWSGYNWYQGNYRQPHPGQHRSAARAWAASSSSAATKAIRATTSSTCCSSRIWRAAAAGSSSCSTRSIRRRASSPRARPITASSSPSRATSGSNSRRRVLYPLAGLSSDGAETYLELQNAMRGAGRRPLHHRPRPARRPDHPRAGDRAAPSATSCESRRRAEQSIAFTEHYRAYVINYGLGQDDGESLYRARRARSGAALGGDAAAALRADPARDLVGTP